jgi:hypothetical protein
MTGSLRSVVAERPAAGAVSFRGAMGLLDEAIREHLELKRRAGADPSLVAREEQEALAPVPRDDPEAPGADSEPGLEAETGSSPADHPEPVPTHEPARPDPPPGAIPMLSEETQELDMVAAMADEPVAGDDPSSPTWSVAERLEAAEDAGEEPAHRFSHSETIGEDDHRQPPEEVPGQERLSFD